MNTPKFRFFRGLTAGQKLAVAALAVFGAASAIVSCQETSPLPMPIGPAASIAASNPARRGPVAPAMIRLQKPRLLGPVAPAIVAVPEAMKEPLIRVRLTDEKSSPPWVKKAAYRGRIETVKLADGNYVAVNVLPLDEYLAGVLNKEMLPGWDAAAFRAQAIASRTFALFQILSASPARQWDVNCDETSQMYAGISAESPKTRAAVADTRGEVLTASARGQSGIFCAFFSACTGGASQDPEAAWGDPAIAPLAARELGAVDSNCPKFSWPTLTVSKADISRCVRSWGERNGFAYLQALGPIKTVVISKRNAATHRPTELTLTDTAGKSAPIRPEEFRLSLLYDPENAAPKPLSSNFNIVDGRMAIALTNGHGFGHGIGMSQWGAQALALKGWTHTQILAFYYPTAKLRQLW